eukprot:gene18451-24930_t
MRESASEGGHLNESTSSLEEEGAARPEESDPLEGFVLDADTGYYYSTQLGCSTLDDPGRQMTVSGWSTATRGCTPGPSFLFIRIMSKNPLNVLQSTVTKVARKFDGHITNLASGVTSSVSSIADTVQMDRKHSRHHAPDILEASSFVRKPGTPNAETPSGSLAHESSTTDVEYVADAQQNAKPWWQEPGCDYLCVTVRRARNLAIMDYEAKSSHSSVKVTLGGKGASVHYDEHTRTVSRSRHPMWQQSRFMSPNVAAE